MAIQWRNGRLAAGKIRHRIDIVLPDPTQDSTGGINLSVDIVYAQRWASVEATAGNESAGAGTEIATVTYQIVLRFIPAAQPWQPGFNYSAGALVMDPGGYLQQAQADGLSGTDTPPWDETQGNQTDDGDPSIGVSWKNLGVAPPRTGVTAAMQIWWQGRQLQITSVQNPDGRRKMLCIMAEEINSSTQQITKQPGGLA